MTDHTKVHVDLAERSYDIHIGKGLLAQINDLIPFSLEGRDAFILYDENTYPYAQVLEETITRAQSIRMLSVKGGEPTKSYNGYQDVMTWLLEKGVNRQSVLVTLGGGVVGDLGGFVASTVMRGIDYIQIPTTLLSQIDSSVGGKTGINTKEGKNLVGTFYQPKAVICDTSTLGTLPERELQAGYGEMVKYGLINKPEFFEWLEENGEAVLKLEPSAISYAVKVSCESKAEIVEADEKESGQRALLNLGHTFGHALEAVCKYDGRLLHGEAVAIGMMMAFELSHKMGLCSQEDPSRIAAHLKSHGLRTKATDIDPAIPNSAEEIVELMYKDKKAQSRGIGFILANGIGKSFQSYDVDMDLVRNVVKESMGV